MGAPTPSSICPLQSSSTPLQTSATGFPSVALHTVAPPSGEQIFTPLRAHAPPPTVQGVPTSNPSSTAPLQLSSTPLPQNSGPGLPGEAVHTVPLPSVAQTCEPLRAQTPTPTV